jgi:hypothetical protein
MVNEIASCDLAHRSISSSLFYCLWSVKKGAM